MKKRTRYQAAVPAWVLIAAMGMSPVFSAVGITGNGVVYGSELVSGTRGVYAGENVGQDGILAGSLLGYSDSGSDREGEWEKESGRSPEWKNLVRIATPSQAEPKTGAGQEGEPDEKEALDGTGERIRGSAVFDSSYKKAAKELESETELRVATASNAVMSLRRASIWGGMEMSDHFDGEGTKENPYQINSAKDLKLLAYNVANEEVDGYEGCYFTLSRDISLSDSASWLPIGYFTELGDSEPKPFKGNFDGQGYRVYNLKISDTTQDYAGLFVGFIESGTVELGDDLAYLYTDSEDKYSLNPFGNKLTPQIRLEHHIGAYYSNQRDFSLYQMGGIYQADQPVFL